MQWWTDFNEWLYSDAGWRVVSTVIVPFVAIILSAVIAALIARSFVRRLLAREDRDDRASAVATFIEVARQSTQWANLPDSNKEHARMLASAASVRLRLLPSHGAAAAAEWAEHQVQKIRDNSATFSMQSEQDYVEFRDRLTEWQHKPKAARRLFAADLAEFKAADTAVEEDLVERQRQWAAEQAAAEQLAAERAAADAAAANALDGVNAASSGSAFTGPIATVEPSDEPAPRLRSNFEAPEVHEAERVADAPSTVYPITPAFEAHEVHPDSDSPAVSNIDDESLAPSANDTITFEPSDLNGTQVFAPSESVRPSYDSNADTGAEFEQGFRERLEAEQSAAEEENSSFDLDAAAEDDSPASSGADGSASEEAAPSQHPDWATQLHNEEPPPLQEPDPARSYHDYAGAVPAVDFGVIDNDPSPATPAAQSPFAPSFEPHTGVFTTVTSSEAADSSEHDNEPAFLADDAGAETEHAHDEHGHGNDEHARDEHAQDEHERAYDEHAHDDHGNEGNNVHGGDQTENVSHEGDHVGDGSAEASEDFNQFEQPSQASNENPPHIAVDPTGPITTVDGTPIDVVEATVDEEKPSPFSRPRFYDS